MKTQALSRMASDDGAVIPTRLIAYLIDDLHLPAGEFIAAREAARKDVRDTLQAGDRAAIFTTSGNVMLDFTHASSARSPPPSCSWTISLAPDVRADFKHCRTRIPQHGPL
jgi:hypothetical protein